jgi:hypothetical protein
MTKRIAATVLWFIAATYAGSMTALLTGMSDLFGVVVGIIVATFVAWDPAHLIWTARTASASVETTPEPA